MPRACWAGSSVPTPPSSGRTWRRRTRTSVSVRPTRRRLPSSGRARRPGDAVLSVRIGALHTQAGESVAAEAAFRHALQIAPGRSDASFHLAKILSERSYPDVGSFIPGIVEALGILRRLVDSDPRQDRWWHQLGIAGRRSANWQEAKEAHTRAVRLLPTSFDYRCGLGEVLLFLREWTEATASFRRAVVIRPDHADAHRRLGDALLGGGDLVEAEAEYRRALELGGEARARGGRGRSFFGLGRYADAVMELTRIEAPSADELLALGRAHAHLGRPDLAERAFGRCLQEHGATTEVLFRLGCAAADQGSWPAAATRLDGALALALDTDDVRLLMETLLMRGVVFEIMDQPDEATAAYARAATTGPETEVAPRRRTRHDRQLHANPTCQSAAAIRSHREPVTPSRVRKTDTPNLKRAIRSHPEPAAPDPPPNLPFGTQPLDSISNRGVFRCRVATHFATKARVPLR